MPRPVAPPERQHTKVWPFRRKASANVVDLANLRSTIDALRTGVRDQLLKAPLYSLDLEHAEWTIFERVPSNVEEAGEYTDHADVMGGVTIDTDLMNAAMCDPLFCSERFSRFGERFAFVRFDISDVDPDERLRLRNRLEDEIGSALQSAKLGAVVGAALGVQYGYVHFGLSKLSEGISCIRQTLSGSDLPHRGWIQFFDADLAAEWVGIFDDAPPPPVRAMDA